MRLSIKNWPPVASHVVVFVFGVIFSQLWVPEEKTVYELEAGQALLRLPPSFFSGINLAASQDQLLFWLANQKSKKAKKEYCRVDFAPVKLVQVDPYPIVAMPLSDLRAVASLGVKKDLTLQLASQSEVRLKSKCYEELRISYGL